jgi:hypothetical protein
MAIVTTGTGIFVTSTTQGLYAIIDFLRVNTAWKIIGSGDGTSGGLGTPGAPIDVIDVDTDLSDANFWLVWQVGTDLQVLLQRNASNEYELFTNIALDYAGGDATTRPTSSGGNAISFGVFDIEYMVSGTKLHITADNGPTLASANWFAFVLKTTDILMSQFHMGCMSLSNLQAGYNHPYAFLYKHGGISDMNSTALYQDDIESGGFVRVVSPETGVMTNYAAISPARYASLGYATTAVNNMGQALNGDDWMWPVLVSYYAGEHVGTATFMMRTGTARDVLSLFNNRTRIGVGNVSFPWDGVSVPLQN